MSPESPDAPLMDPERDESYEDLQRRHRALAERHSAELRLSRLIGSGGGGGLAAIVNACSELTSKVVALFDSHDRLITSAGPARFEQSRIPPIERILSGVAELPRTDRPVPTIAPALPAQGVPRRHLIVPVVDTGEPFGQLVVMEHPTPIRRVDEFIASRSGEHLATEFTVQRRVAGVAWNARASLARQLVRGTSNDDDLRSCAEYLGIDTDARRVLAYVLGTHRQCDADDDDEQLAIALGRTLGVEVLTTRGSEGTLLLIEAPRDRSPVAMVGRVKSAVRAAIAEPDRGDVIVGVSSVCEPATLPRAYRDAREVARCIDRFVPSASTRVLAVDDLGPARLFIANSDVTAVQRYVDDVLGSLLTGRPHGTTLLLTLQSYFDAGRSVRITATRLGVHENTIRLRLARAHTATGLDVLGDANDQLSVQTALLVLRLQGHSALPSFDDITTQQDRRISA